MYGVVMENLQSAEKWLEGRKRTLGNLVFGTWLERDDLTEEHVTLHSAAPENTVTVQKCSDELVREIALQGMQKAKQPIARAEISKFFKQVSTVLEQQNALLLGLETLVTGRTVSELKSIDSISWQKAIKASTAEIENTNANDSVRSERSLVIVELRSSCSPLLTLLTEVTAALAYGNTVLVLVRRNLSASLLALLHSLPADSLSHVAVLHSDSQADSLAANAATIRVLDGIATPQAASQCQDVSYWQQRARSVALIFEDSDLRSAANGVLDSLTLANGQHSFCTRIVYVQHSVFSQFQFLLAERCNRVSVGTLPNDRNADTVAISASHVAMATSTKQFLASCETVRVQGGEDVVTPTFVCELPPSDCDLLALPAPIALLLPFRTPFDAVALCTQRQLAVRDAVLTVYSADFSMAYELARRLPRFRTVLHNAHVRMFLPSLLSLVERPSFFQLTKLRPVAQSDSSAAETESQDGKSATDVTQSCNTKLFIAGKSSAGESARLASISLASGQQVAINVATAGDVRNAIESARSVQSPWQRKKATERLSVTLQFLHAISNSVVELSALLSVSSGLLHAHATQQLRNAMSNLKRVLKVPCAEFAEESLFGPVQALVMRSSVPLGVVTIVLACGPVVPLFALATAAVLVALLAGNSVVLLATDSQSMLAALALQRSVLAVGSAFNPALLSLLAVHCNADAVRTALQHHELDAVWLLGNEDLGAPWLSSLAPFRLPQELGLLLVKDCECNLDAALNELLLRACSERLTALPFGSIFADV